jgi:hypothetical protein
MSSIVPRDDQLVKLLYQDMLHRDYQWSMGRHQHPKPEPFARGCHSGSFYITTWGDAMRWLRIDRLMYWVADAEPHGDTYASANKIHVHEVTLSNPRKLRDVFRAMSPEQHLQLVQKGADVISYIDTRTHELELAAVRAHGGAIQYTSQTREFQIAAVVCGPVNFTRIREPEPDLVEILSQLHPSGISRLPREFHTPATMHRALIVSPLNIQFMPGAPAEYWREYVSRGRPLRTVMLSDIAPEFSPWRFVDSDILRIVKGWPGAIEHLDSRHLTAEVLAEATRAERQGAPMELMSVDEYLVWRQNLCRTCPISTLPRDVKEEIEVQRVVHTRKFSQVAEMRKAQDAEMHRMILARYLA